MLVVGGFCVCSLSHRSSISEETKGRNCRLVQTPRLPRSYIGIQYVYVYNTGILLYTIIRSYHHTIGEPRLAVWYTDSLHWLLEARPPPQYHHIHTYYTYIHTHGCTVATDMSVVCRSHLTRDIHGGHGGWVAWWHGKRAPEGLLASLQITCVPACDHLGGSSPDRPGHTHANLTGACRDVQRGACAMHPTTETPLCPLSKQERSYCVWQCLHTCIIHPAIDTTINTQRDSFCPLRRTGPCSD